MFSVLLAGAQTKKTFVQGGFDSSYMEARKLNKSDTGAMLAPLWTALTGKQPAMGVGTNTYVWTTVAGVAQWAAPTGGGGGGGTISSLNGQTGATQTFASIGTTGIVPNWVSASDVHTLHIPDANYGGRGLINNTAQTIWGVKTLKSNVTLPATLKATGYGMIIQDTLNATADSQVVVGLRMQPYLNDGGFLGVAKVPFQLDWGNANRFSISSIVGNGSVTLHTELIPTALNYFVRTSGGTVMLNAPSSTGQIFFRIGGSSRAMIFDTTGNFLIENGLGSPADIPESKLTINSTTAGILIPRMRRSHINAIAATQKGLLMYDSTLNKFVYKDGAINKVLLDSAAAAALYGGGTAYFPEAGGALTGTGGAGYIEFPVQTSNPVAPSGGFRIWAKSDGEISWVPAGGYARSVTGKYFTGPHKLNIQNMDYTAADSAFLSNVASDVGTLNAQILLKANLASPPLTGTPTAPTAAAGTNTTQIATTAHVFAERTNTATLTNKTLTSPVINTPTGIVKGDVGLGNVDNTSNATERAATATLANKTLTTPVINGLATGTGVASAATASTIVTRDADANANANSFNQGFATTATAAGTTTLTVASAFHQFFTGTSNQTVQLPVVSTLSTGKTFYLVNNSTGAITVNSSGGNLIQILSAGTQMTVTVVSTSGTTAASWYTNYTGKFDRVLFESNARVTNDNSSAENTVYTATIPAYSISQNGSWDFVCLFSASATAGTKTMKLKIGGVQIATLSFTTNSFYSVNTITIIRNQNSYTAQVSAPVAANANLTFNNASNAVPAALTFSSTGDLTFTITLQNGTASVGETSYLESVRCVAHY